MIDTPGKTIIFSAPSGSGKTTLVRKMMQEFSELTFSVSATTRSPRKGETSGIDYYFMEVGQFKSMIDENYFAEWEEVYKDVFYGTLKSEIKKNWDMGKVVVFDVDVAGGRNLKNYFGSQALSIFVRPPSLETLRERLLNRGTESEDEINKRLDKAGLELTFEKYFDEVIINDDLDKAAMQCRRLVGEFLKSSS